MSTNPFDKVQTPEDRVPGEHPHPLQALQADIQKRLQTCEQDRQQHHDAWRQHKKEHHERRLEQALEREAAEGRFIPPIVQAEWDERDDALYAKITDFDQLLELPTHEEYLRARRAWERRHKVEEVELNVEVHGTLTGTQAWAVFLALGLLVVWVGAMAVSPLGIVMIVPLAIIWAALARLPGIYAGTFSDNRGGARGASGNAV